MTLKISTATGSSSASSLATAGLLVLFRYRTKLVV